MEIALLTPYITALNSLDDATYRAQVDLLKRAVRDGGEVRTPARDALETDPLMHRILEAAKLPGMDT